MALTVTVLGSSGTCAGPGGACSGYLLRTPTTAVMVDVGPGTFANLQQHLDPAELDAVVVTHAHPDHWTDLPMMLNGLKYVVGVEGLALHTTAQTVKYAEYVSSGGLGPTFVTHVVTDGSRFGVGDLEFTCSATDHPVETLALRVDHEGRSFAYTSDTGPGWSLAQLGDGIDLAISEATFLEGTEHAAPVHLSALQAGKAARAAGVARLVIGHLLPVVAVDDAVAEASDAYGAPVDVAEVHRTFDV